MRIILSHVGGFRREKSGGKLGSRTLTGDETLESDDEERALERRGKGKASGPRRDQWEVPTAAGELGLGVVPLGT